MSKLSKEVLDALKDRHGEPGWFETDQDTGEVKIGLYKSDGRKATRTVTASGNMMQKIMHGQDLLNKLVEAKRNGGLDSARVDEIVTGSRSAQSRQRGLAMNHPALNVEILDNLEEFLTFRGRRCGTDTVLDYRKQFRAFARAPILGNPSNGAFADCRPLEIQPAHLQYWVDNHLVFISGPRKGQPKTGKALKRALSPVRMYCQWMLRIASAALNQTDRDVLDKNIALLTPSEGDQDYIAGEEDASIDPEGLTHEDMERKARGLIDKRPFDDEEIQRLIDLTPKQFPRRAELNLFLFGLYTGMRPAELMALGWGDIKHTVASWTEPGSERKVKVKFVAVWVLRSVSTTGYSVTKTKKSTRYFFLNDKALEILNQQKKVTWADAPTTIQIYRRHTTQLSDKQDVRFIFKNRNVRAAGPYRSLFAFNILLEKACAIAEVDYRPTAATRNSYITEIRSTLGREKDFVIGSATGTSTQMIDFNYALQANRKSQQELAKVIPFIRANDK